MGELKILLFFCYILSKSLRLTWADGITFEDPIINNKECFCVPVHNSGLRVSEILSSELQQDQRLAVYFYKNSNNDVSIYIPNSEKQAVLPEFSLDSNDILDKRTTVTTHDLISLKKFYITLPDTVNSQSIEKNPIDFQPGTSGASQELYSNINYSQLLSQLWSQLGAISQNINLQYGIKLPNIDFKNNKNISVCCNNFPRHDQSKLTNKQNDSLNHETVDLDIKSFHDLLAYVISILNATNEPSRPNDSNLHNILSYIITILNNKNISLLNIGDLENFTSHISTILDLKNEYLNLPLNNLQGLLSYIISILRNTIEFSNLDISNIQDFINYVIMTLNANQEYFNIDIGILRDVLGSILSISNEFDWPDAKLIVFQDILSNIIAKLQEKMEPSSIDDSRFYISISGQDNIKPEIPESWNIIIPENNEPYLVTAENLPPNEIVDYITVQINEQNSFSDPNNNNGQFWVWSNRRKGNDLINHQIPNIDDNNDTESLLIIDNPEKSKYTYHASYEDIGPQEEELVDQPLNYIKPLRNSNKNPYLYIQKHKGGTQNEPHNSEDDKAPLKNQSESGLNIDKSPIRNVLDLNLLKHKKPSFGRTFDQWFSDQVKYLKTYKYIISYDLNLRILKNVLQKTLKNNGISLTKDGSLVDLKGKLLSLDRLKLHPVIIGDPIKYTQFISSGKCVPFNNLPYLDGILLTLTEPYRYLGSILLKEVSTYNKSNLPVCPPKQNLYDFNVIPKHGKDIFPSKELASGDDSLDIGLKIIGGSPAISSGTPVSSKGRRSLNI